MVDVGAKAYTLRTATAKGRVRLSSYAFSLVRDNGMKKGDVLTVAQIAGIQAAKQTGHLIPLCHPIALSSVKLDLKLNEQDTCVDIAATVSCHGQTGVEMEALVAVSVSACTVFDMCKAVDKGMVIMDLRVTGKSGGASGDWEEERGQANVTPS
ncbi:Cyclic pyranopterin monophosphate synthase, mitochondrial [Thoreauomyces humboldtii]|nr:Cyclic pyranopterin monophosphate synthase, mitochondrial [Thoreauomyces humboldtii]